MTIQEIQYKFNLAFNDLKFDEARHLYFLHGDRLPSVSSLIEGHYAKTDFKPMRDAIAKRENVSPAEIQSRWDEIRDTACERGTETHLYAENYTGREEADTELKKSIKKFLDNLPSHYEIAIREARMYSSEFRYAGTSDLVVLDKRYDTLVIMDYKTNKDLFKNYGQVMYPPFENKLVCPMSKYHLQLSYYQLMLEQLGYPVSQRYVIHIIEEQKAPDPSQPYLIYQTPNYTKELKQTLSHANR